MTQAYFVWRRPVNGDDSSVSSKDIPHPDDCYRTEMIGIYTDIVLARKRFRNETPDEGEAIELCQTSLNSPDEEYCVYLDTKCYKKDASSSSSSGSDDELSSDSETVFGPSTNKQTKQLPISTFTKKRRV